MKIKSKDKIGKVKIVKYYITFLLLILQLKCTNSTKPEGETSPFKGNWSKVVTITKFNNDTFDYTDNIFELHFCTDNVWNQYLKTGDQTKKYEWEYIFEANNFYRYYPGTNCGKTFSYIITQDTIILEDSLLIHKWTKYDSTEIPSIWKANLIEISMDSINPCK